jgi:hypothetical protein
MYTLQNVTVCMYVTLMFCISGELVTEAHKKQLDSVFVKRHAAKPVRMLHILIIYIIFL